MFAGSPGFALGGTASDPRTLAEQLDDYPADVVVADAPIDTWPNWRAALAAATPSPAIVMIAAESVLPLARPAALASALSLIAASASPDAFLATVRAAALGLHVLPSGRHRTIDTPLTAREREVLAMLADGLSNKHISKRLGISPNTTKFHVSGILDKLAAGTRAEAVALALRGGMLAR